MFKKKNSTIRHVSEFSLKNTELREIATEIMTTSKLITFPPTLGGPR